MSDSMRIPFSRPKSLGHEISYVEKVLASNKWSGDGEFTLKCARWLEECTGAPKALLTPSCTASLEMAALMLELGPGDEVILPSYTFVSSASAFALRGAKLKFVDVKPETMNLDEVAVERAITSRTKAICVVHYGGIACEMDRILEIARSHDVAVVEDAAQGVLASYRGRALGGIGDVGCFSFHDTKNVSCGEGGATLIGRADWVGRAETIREKGTDRSRFLRGEVDKYTWRELGSSFLMSEINAAVLWAQLEGAMSAREARVKIWRMYHEALRDFEVKERIELSRVPEYCDHNAHLFFIKLRDVNDRMGLAAYLCESGIGSASHYVPLHTSVAGRKFGEFVGEDRVTSRDSVRLLRLPLHQGVSVTAAQFVCDRVGEYLSR